MNIDAHTNTSGTSRLVAFVNGDLGVTALKVLSTYLCGVVLHPPERRRDGHRLLQAIPAQVPVHTYRDESSLNRWLRDCQPSHGISVLFGYIFHRETLGIFANKLANLHLSYLPWGRGAHPNAWALAEGHPCGITLHLVDHGVDTGDILAQAEIDVHGHFTAKDLYLALIREAELRLPQWLNDFINDTLTATPQPSPAPCPTRRVRDLYSTLCIKADKHYRGKELIDLLRATSFSPHPGAIYDDGTQRLRVRITLESEEDTVPTQPLQKDDTDKDHQ